MSLRKLARSWCAWPALLCTLLLGWFPLASFAQPFLVTNTNDAGAGSFRQAILDANASAGSDVIQFQIPGTVVHSITPLSALPDISEPVVVDATTDDSYAANMGRPAIILDGNGLGADGLVLMGTASGCTIRGLVIRDFGYHGIRVAPSSNGHTIAGNYVGRLTATGTDAGAGEENSISGIYVQGTGCLIGGPGPQDGNLIAWNTERGIYLMPSATGCRVEGNTVHHSGYSGIFDTAGNAVVVRNTSHNNGVTFGFDDVVISANTVLLNNTILYGNGDGVSVEGANTIVRNNIIVGNAGLGIAVSGGSMSVESNNLITNSSTPPANAGGRANVALSASDPNADPLFTSLALPDVTPLAGSPAINSGVNAGAAQPDMNGALPGLFNGTAPEIGAVEVANQPPTALCRNLTVNLDGAGDATITAAMVDNGSSDADGTIASNIVSPNSFSCGNIGLNTVTLTVTDDDGATATCTATITVVDASAPTFVSCPGNMVLSAGATCNATANWSVPTATDNCAAPGISQTAGPANGSSLGVGGYSVNYRATDASGNISNCSFTITVQDAAPPVITCPADIVVQVPAGVTTAVATYSMPTASDNCSAATITQYSGLPSGGTFPLGNSVVVYQAADAAGNIARCGFNVLVMTCPADIVLPNQVGQCGAVASWGTLTTAYDQGFEGPGPGLGGTGWNASNSSVTRVTSGTDGITSASGAFHLSNDPAASPTTGAFTRMGGAHTCFGGGFSTSMDVYMDLSDARVGTNTYGWDNTSAINDINGVHRRDFIFHTASDASGRILVGASNNTSFTRRTDLAMNPHYAITTSGWYTFRRTYRDQAGVLAVDFELLSASGTLLWSRTLTDPIDLIAGIGGSRNLWFLFLETGRLAVDNTRLVYGNAAESISAVSGSLFPVGTTTVTHTTTTACGATVTCAFDVIVNDTQAPVISCPANIVTNVDPDACTAVVNYTTPGATDNCSGVTVARTAGLASGSNFPPGINTVTYRATDAAGNSTTCSFTVTVNAPPDMDGDGLCDNADLDDDNDGIPDTVEGCGNLIRNGSFEADDFTNAALYPGGFTSANGTFMGVTYNSNTMTAWQYTLNCDGWREGGAWANAYDGGQYLDLIGNTNATGGVPSVLYQDMPTIPGQQYDLTFHWGEDVGHNPGQVVTLNARILDASSNVLFDTTLTVSAVGPLAGVRGPNTWFVLQRGFTASTSSTRLALTAIPPAGNSGAGAVVDAISVVTRNPSCRDSDGDGISDSRDLDSDNDGIYDCVESGSAQPYAAGVLNGAVAANGIPVSVDANANGVVDYSIRDSDADGSIDSMEMDADGDGCNDVIEAGYSDANSDGRLGPAPLTVDTNGLVTSGNN